MKRGRGKDSQVNLINQMKNFHIAGKIPPFLRQLQLAHLCSVLLMYYRKDRDADNFRWRLLHDDV